MIKINRTACPDFLDTKRRKLGANDYAHQTVVDALLEMQYFKCCFCEKYLPDIGRTAQWVEHFIAKTSSRFKNANNSINWNQANAWTNLLFSCSTCNSSKGRLEPFSPSGHRKLIDPSDSSIDPENYIDFIIIDEVIVYKSKGRGRLGRNTIQNLKLQSRMDIYSFLRKQKTIIDSNFSDLVNALMEGNNHMVQSNLNDLRRKTSAHQPHASFNRKYIAQKIAKFNQIDLPKINLHYGSQINPINIALATGSTYIQ
jgi:hypothetical protein